MQRQVINTPDFVRCAPQSLILVDVDFPEKHKQDEELARANLELKRKFNLSPERGEAYPTIVLLNEAGETLNANGVGWNSSSNQNGTQLTG